MTAQFEKRVFDLYPAFSKSHKKIADYILADYDKAAFMTAAALGKNLGLSEATVVRFAVEMGFNGYHEFQKYLQEIIKNRLTSIQRLEVSSARIGGNDILDRTMLNDIEMIRATVEKTSREEFAASVKKINGARKIYILGVRSAAALASFAAFYFNLLYDNVVLIDNSGADQIFEQLFHIGKEDVCIAISFPRYSRKTVSALRFVRDRGASIISITDSELSPIAEIANHLLIAHTDTLSFVDSLVAPLSLINALISQCARSKTGEEAFDNLRTLEQIWREYQVYDTYDDID